MSIEDYELENDTWTSIAADDDEIAIDTGCDVVELTKRDVIAMAKHFKLTADDLEG